MTHQKLPTLILVLLCLFPGMASSLDIWQKYSKLNKLSADFTQTKEIKSVGVTLKSKGSLRFERPGFFEWTVISPKNFVFIFKDNNISLVEDGKILKSADSAKFDKKLLEAITHLKAWMMIDQKFIEENYSIKNISTDSYEFIPKSDVKMFKSIQIELGKNYPIKKISLKEISNDVIVIEFSKTKMSYEN
jgi:outer membrane lipoprotein-sorting protein